MRRPPTWGTPISHGALLALTDLEAAQLHAQVIGNIERLGLKDRSDPGGQLLEGLERDVDPLPLLVVPPNTSDPPLHEEHRLHVSGLPPHSLVVPLIDQSRLALVAQYQGVEAVEQSEGPVGARRGLLSDLVQIRG